MPRESGKRCGGTEMEFYMEKQIFDTKKYAALAREAAAEGVVLLKNDNKVLPLKSGSRLAVFGRSQFNYYKSGTGSGGLVNAAYVTGILDALEADERFEINAHVKETYETWLKDHPFDVGEGWAQEPWFQEEMPLSGELLQQAREESDVAVLILGRTAGEDKDNKAEKGSYLLTDEEEEILAAVCGTFDKTIVLLNVGNIIDMKWVAKYNPAAVAYVWQGGQEGGSGVLDVLSGTVSPSGRLADTIAYDITDYPSTDHFGDELRNLYVEDIYVGYRYFETFAKDKVVYPFGFGLSYTTFDVNAALLENTKEALKFTVTVQNTGDTAGKTSVLLYCQAPQGKLGKPARVLCGFGKTGELQPGTSEMLEIVVPWSYIASYDDSGVTGKESAYVLEAGDYRFYAGGDVRSAEEFTQVKVEELIVVEQLTQALAPVLDLEKMKPVSNPDSEKEGASPYIVSWEKATLRKKSLAEKRLEHLPKEVTCTGDQGYRLCDVKNGKVSMEQFLAQIPDEDLSIMVRGEGMCSSKVTPGTAGAFGGVGENLKHFGIPVACCADGPSGIRMDVGTEAFAMPGGASLGCTFNTELVKALYEFEGLELRKNKVDTLLGPGINIHRSPLNGRNFEYFSEDPLLTGKMAAVQVQSMNKYGVTGTVKHFACNSQEYKRRMVDAVASERALREIYLKGFEIAVKEGGAYSIMTSYNPINGDWSASNYDLLTVILRGEWGYTGIVMTDWWAMGNDPGEIGSVQNVASMIRAQNDLFMVTPNPEKNTNQDNSMEALAAGTVTRAEYVRTATNICQYLMTTPAYLRFYGEETELDRQLAACVSEKDKALKNAIPVSMDEEISLDVNAIDTTKGKTTVFAVSITERGTYGIEVVCKAAEGTAVLAQLPMTVFMDKELIKTISITGTQLEWQTFSFEIPGMVFNSSFLLKFFFAQTGLELKSIRVIRTKSMEEELRKQF